MNISRRELSVLVGIGLFLGPSVARGTTWGDATLTDPLTGDKVPARTIMSFGSYIYEWPSKFDLVFWPMTDENFICLNPANGYAAFNDEFEKLTPEEVAKLKEWLPLHYNPEQRPKTHLEKLAWLERVYEQRQMPPEFWRRFYCLMAYMHRENAEQSMSYVKKALPLLQAELQAGPEGVARFEVLYLLGEYHRRLGDNQKAREFFVEVRRTKFTDKDGKTKNGHPYFVGLVRDREKLMAAPTSEAVPAGDPASTTAPALAP